ncbi:hypothetical protein Tco_0890780 [Tanacetum coccineum]|uniref:Uncharacterized protein n=1 Tax=Tanacetum coccineum TaxID=301880 RepID=A0ABQ5C2L9_9ASTR
MKKQAYNIIKTKDSRTQRQSNLKKFKEARFKILPQEFEDHTLGKIEILERAHMQNCNPCKKPVDTKSKLGPDGDLVSYPTLYRSLGDDL